MKWRLMTAFAALCMLIPAFVSCNDDEPEDPTGGKDEEQTVDLSKVVGTYSGEMTCDVSAMGQTWNDLTIEGEKEVKIIKNDKTPGRVTLIIPECSYMPPMAQSLQTIPSMTVENVEVKDLSADLGAGMYTLYTEEYAVPVGDVQYTVSIRAYEVYSSIAQTGTLIKGSDMKLVYSVTPGKMPGVITFTFDGSRK